MKFFITISLFSLLLVPLVVPIPSYALGFEDAQGQLEEAGGQTGLPEGEIESLAGTIIRTVLSIVGVIFMILMVYGGFLWMTARENAQQAEDAMKVIKAAFIGIIIVVLSYGITFFVIEQLLGGAPAEEEEEGAA